MTRKRHAATAATALAVLIFGAGVAVGRTVAAPGSDRAPQSDEVLIARLFREPFTCSQHPYGQLAALGDALGSDCVVLGVRVDGNESFPRPYRTDGSSNEDWVGWRAEVHAPFDGTVERVESNPVTNTPGTLGAPPASAVTFLRDDGTRVTFAHVQEVTVGVGDRVRRGQSVARVGNNGRSWMPHVHVGAWRDDAPLQIRFDLGS